MNTDPEEKVSTFLVVMHATLKNLATTDPEAINSYFNDVEAVTDEAIKRIAKIEREAAK